MECEQNFTEGRIPIITISHRAAQVNPPDKKRKYFTKI